MIKWLPRGVRVKGPSRLSAVATHRPLRLQRGCRGIGGGRSTSLPDHEFFHARRHASSAAADRQGRGDAARAARTARFPRSVLHHGGAQRAVGQGRGGGRASPASGRPACPSRRHAGLARQQRGVVDPGAGRAGVHGGRDDSLPILVDGDTGYGNFNNVRRLVRKLGERGDRWRVPGGQAVSPRPTRSWAKRQPLADVDGVLRPASARARTAQTTDDKFSPGGADGGADLGPFDGRRRCAGPRRTTRPGRTRS